MSEIHKKIKSAFSTLNFVVRQKFESPVVGVGDMDFLITIFYGTVVISIKMTIRAIYYLFFWV